MENFGPVAPYYDELMRMVPYNMWVSYYLLLLSNQEVHPKHILDVCCGTGTMCEMLVRDGFQVSGLDLSPGMIDAARRKAKRRKLDIDYHVADASNFDLGQKFGGCLSFFDSLNNILDPSGLQKAFTCVANHLEEGGSWIFDLNTAYAFEEHLFDQENMRQNAKMRYKWQGNWDPDTRIITVDMIFWRDGERFTETHRQRAYDTEEVTEMLVQAGFGEIRAFHSYTLDPPRAKSDRLHYTAIKL
jgi:ubiquinone/menaquinone biosynthesis C-methylase UbiE